jgi:hypothetical protein
VCLCECDREASITRTPWSTSGCYATKKMTNKQNQRFWYKYLKGGINGSFFLQKNKPTCQIGIWLVWHVLFITCNAANNTRISVPSPHLRRILIQSMTRTSHTRLPAKQIESVTPHTHSDLHFSRCASQWSEVTHFSVMLFVTTMNGVLRCTHDTECTARISAYLSWRTHTTNTTTWCPPSAPVLSSC